MPQVSKMPFFDARRLSPAPDTLRLPAAMLTVCLRCYAVYATRHALFYAFDYADAMIRLLPLLYARRF